MAHAELDLQWSAPPGCPERQTVMDKLRAIAGSALDESDGLLVHGTITREAGRARLELLVRDGDRQERREIASESCSALAGAAAVTLALLMGVEDPNSSANDDATAPDPNADGAAEANARSDVATELGAQAAEADGPVAENAERDRDVTDERSGGLDAGSPRDWAFLVRAPVLTADLGPLPQPALGIGVAIGLRYEAWSFLVGAQLSREQDIDGGLAQEATGAELQRATAQLSICRGWRWGTFEAAPCLGLGIERVSARGFGDGVAAQPRRALWPAAGVAAALHWHTLESLAFFASVSGYLELSRPRLVIQDLGEIRQLGPATLGAAIGLEWIL